MSLRSGSWAFMLLAAVGCGGDGLVEATGTVKYADGTPVAGESSTIVFQPLDAAGQAASGVLNADGSFTLMTKTPGDGAAPGQYKVVLKVWKSYRDQTLAVPEAYADAETTPLTATVDASSSRFDFIVEQ